MGILSIFKKGNTVYYPGCLSKFVLKAETENYRRILDKMSFDYITIPDISCCGSPVINAGYESDARKLALKNLDLFKQCSVRKIVTNCPACFKMFSQDYKSMLPEWNIEVEHIVIPILSFLEKNPQKIKKHYEQEEVVYHDPCHLGRHSGIYEQPREILRKIGYNLIEMKHNREKSLCCGGGAGLKSNNPELSNSIAKQLVNEAKSAGAKKIITTCPLCFSSLAENSDIEIIEFSYAVAEALGIHPEKTDIKKVLNEKTEENKEENKTQACS